jgi:hypothetical protein
VSLGIAFKGAEGIVLAADSRVTLMAVLLRPPGPEAPGTAPATGTPGSPQQIVPATFDNATKLLRVSGQNFVGAVTYGAGAIGLQQPRTAHSFIPEFEAELAKKSGDERLSVQEFAKELSDFFLRQWQAQGMPMNQPPGANMVFLVGGYDADAPYGRVFEIYIPSRPEPIERQVDDFGMTWGGQREYTDRLIAGFDPGLLSLVQASLHLTDAQRDALGEHLKGQLQAPIPFQFLPLQDCVNLSILLIRTTIAIQTFLVGIRGVGGAIDIATITRTEGLRAIQIKHVMGEGTLQE